MDSIQGGYLKQSSAAQVETQLDRGTFGDSACAFSKRVVRHKEIGSGFFSHVYVGSLTIKERGIPDRFAVKVSDELSDKKFFDLEVKALTLMKECPFVVDMFAYYIDEFPHVLLELGDIDLYKLITIMIKKGIKLTDGNLNFIIDNLSRAAEYMLRAGLSNQDLIEQNVMYFFNQGTLKLMDFNVARLNVPTEENIIMKKIGLIIVYCKLREAHECKQKSRHMCDTCKSTELDSFIDATSWESTSFHLLLKKLTKLKFPYSVEQGESFTGTNVPQNIGHPLSISERGRSNVYLHPDNRQIPDIE